MDLAKTIVVVVCLGLISTAWAQAPRQAPTLPAPPKARPLQQRELTDDSDKLRIRMLETRLSVLEKRVAMLEEEAVRKPGAKKKKGDPLETSGGSSGSGGIMAGTGSPECDEYLQTFDKIVARCEAKFGPAIDAMRQSRDAQVQQFAQWALLDDVAHKATIEAAAASCRSATDAIKQSASAMGCVL